MKINNIFYKLSSFFFQDKYILIICLAILVFVIHIIFLSNLHIESDIQKTNIINAAILTSFHQKQQALNSEKKALEYTQKEMANIPHIKSKKIDSNSVGNVKVQDIRNNILRNNQPQETKNSASFTHKLTNKNTDISLQNLDTSFTNISSNFVDNSISSNTMIQESKTIIDEVKYLHSINISSSSPEKRVDNSQKILLNFPNSQTLSYQLNINGASGLDGKIEWKFDGKTYHIKFFTKIALIGEILQESSGIVNEFGLRPLLYKDYRLKKHYITSFDYEKNIIKFSRNANSKSMLPQVKDFASVAFQLIAMLRANPPHNLSSYEFNVAANDDIQVWKIICDKLESIEITEGRIVKAWHCKRLPRFEGDKRKIEWWLQPSNGWLIAKFKQIEPTGIEWEFIQK